MPKVHSGRERSPKSTPTASPSWSRTDRGETNILTTDATVYKKGEQEIGFNDLMVGDSLVVMGVRKGSDVEAQEITG